MNRTTRILAASASVCLTLLGLQVAGATTKVSANTSDTCTNDGGVTLMSSPATLAVEYSATDHHLAVCYSTSPYGSSFEVAGGQITVDALNTQPTYSNPGGFPIDANCNPDSGAGVSPSCGLAAAPTYQVNGDTVSFQIFFAACAGACPLYQSEGVAQTGVVLGTLVPCSSGGTLGACYALSQVEVLINGVPVVDQDVPVGGVGANPFSQLYENLYGSPDGPCVSGECLPVDGYIETSGVPLVVIDLPTGGVVGVGAPKDCVYNNGTSAATQKNVVQVRRGVRRRS